MIESLTSWLLALIAIIIPGISGPAESSTYFGYVEGDYIYVAARTSGRIDEVFVHDGQEVSKGDPLFKLDSEREQQSLMEAKARLAAAKSNWSDKTTGNREEEIAVVKSKIRSAEADLELAELNYKRAKELSSRQVVALSRQDQDRATLEIAKAKVKQLNNELAVARLPARKAQIDAARQNIWAAEAEVRKAQVELSDRKIGAPAGGRVERVFMRAGEQASPDTPVVSILPPANYKVVFFVSEATRSGIRIGQTVDVNCTACRTPLKAKVSYLSQQVEYTPPVIFSLEERSKLVFRVEARFDEPHDIAVGQPVDVKVVQ